MRKYSYAPLIKAIDAYLAKADDDLADELEASGFAEPKGTADEIHRMEERVAEALKRETSHFMDSLIGAAGLAAYVDEIWPILQDSDTLDEELRGIFAEEFEGYMPGLANSYMRRIDPELTIDQFTKRATRWIQDWSEELGRLMKLTSHGEISAILSSGVEEGRSIAETARALMDSGIRDEYYRARRVAITETLRAHSVAHDEAIRQSPAVEEKEWVHTGAHKNEPRPNHVAMHGTRVPKNEPFRLVGADGMVHHPHYPRDSNLPPGESINCHCMHRGIVSDSILGLSYEERRALQRQIIEEDDGAWEAELDAKNRAKAGIE